MNVSGAMRSGLYRVLAILGACLASPWAAWHQGRIRKNGRVLTDDELGLADALGVSDPEQVLICVTPRVPNPLQPLFCLADHCGFSCLTEAVGITLGLGIYITVDSADSVELIAHELVHVVQYQRAGSIWAFMVEYIHQCLMTGYYDAEWEVEARRVSTEVLGTYLVCRR